MGGRSWRLSQCAGRTHQDDLLNVLGRAPMEHSRGVVLLHIRVHAFDLLVARDEQRVVSDTEGQTEGLYEGFVSRNKKVVKVLQGNVCSHWLGLLTVSTQSSFCLKDAALHHSFIVCCQMCSVSSCCCWTIHIWFFWTRIKGEVWKLVNKLRVTPIFEWHKFPNWYHKGGDFKWLPEEYLYLVFNRAAELNGWPTWCCPDKIISWKMSNICT